MSKIGNQGDGGGRPLFEFKEEDMGQLEILASVLTKGQLADYYGICENTLREVEKRQPEVSEAYKRGRAKQAAKMGGNLVNMALAGNVTAAIFYLKTQAGWKEQEAESKEIPQINITVDPRAINPTSE
tara:strand:- start:258 stop:641 length:384 start_codon:yes stop_codon:yes gene_type:complete